MQIGDFVRYLLHTPGGLVARPAIVLDRRDPERAGGPPDLELVVFTGPGGAVYRGWVQHAPVDARLGNTWHEAR